MDHEEAFAEDAQEEVAIAENIRRRPVVEVVETSYDNRNDALDDYHDGETSPLVSPRQHRRSQRDTYSRARPSYERAINEPWTGSHGSGDKPWHKKPSVILPVLLRMFPTTDSLSRYSGFFQHSFPSASHLGGLLSPKHISSSTLSATSICLIEPPKIQISPICQSSLARKTNNAEMIMSRLLLPTSIFT